ncbi:hypothetical protein VKT23_020234 [Stygiomarasmius scandens]|uniref:Uncharacterized protein n=1 Tax=Marasmiellus scandens TaxID=2682957 RepID=A0ABR1IJS0_9AGAR
MRKWIFNFGYRIASKAVEVFLQPFSYTPTTNTFSERFFKFGVNFFLMFVPDVLHELELGVWKAVLIHLIRILFAYGSDTIQELDTYRQVPTFGRDTIWKIRNNASAMKHLAAWEFEDMLQISIPVFEGLVLEHNQQILDLLFNPCIFHCLAKFRLHSDDSLRMLDERTIELGRSLCSFDDKVCKVYDTKEILKETAARGRQNAKKANEGDRKGKQKATNGEPTCKLFNLCTYKIHALGHYIQFIRLYGTTDNYTTQIGELEHRHVKQFYAHTNCCFKFVCQVTALEKRKCIVESIKLRQQTASNSLVVPFEHSDPLPTTSPKLHYKISEDTSMWKNVHAFMEDNIRDLAMVDFYLKLKEYLFFKLSGQSDTERATVQECGLIDLNCNHIYSHKVLHINYTTYDMCQSQDSINPSSHADIMVHSSDPSTPYWYARVLGIFHADVRYDKHPYRQVDFLWVCWLVVDQDQGQLDLKKKQHP